MVVTFDLNSISNLQLGCFIKYFLYFICLGLADIVGYKQSLVTLAIINKLQ